MFLRTAPVRRFAAGVVVAVVAPVSVLAWHHSHRNEWKEDLPIHRQGRAWFGRSMQAFWGGQNATGSSPISSEPSLNQKRESPPIAVPVKEELRPSHAREETGANAEDKGTTTIPCSSQCPGRLPELVASVMDSIVALRMEQDILVQTGLFRQEEKVLASVGSAFCVHESGLFLTNAHVVSDIATDAAGKMTLTTADGHVYEAVVHSIDVWSDLAVVKVVPPSTSTSPKSLGNPQGQEERHWKPVTFGRAEDLKLGDAVFTIGHPMGLTYSLTTGIISSLHRHNDEIDMTGKMDRRMEYIQTNFSGFDSGNSGGPVFNYQGQVIGINVIKAMTPGICFSVRTDAAQQIISDLITTGKVVRPWLGLRMMTLTKRVVERIYEAHERVQLREEMLELQRIREQELVKVAVKVDKVEVPAPAYPPTWWDMTAQWARYIPFVPNKEAVELAPSGLVEAEGELPMEEEESLVRAMDAGYTSGILVTSVFSPSPASRAEFQPGDIITEVRGIHVETTRQFLQVLGREIQANVPVTVQRYSPAKGKVEPVELTITPEMLDVFEKRQAPLNMGDHDQTYAAYLQSLDQEQREKVRFLEKR